MTAGDERRRSMAVRTEGAETLSFAGFVGLVGSSEMGATVPNIVIDFDPASKPRSLEGVAVAFDMIFADCLPASLLDVGCGPGTWLRAALDAGVSDVVGVDGLDRPSSQLRVAKNLVRQVDLTQPFDLGRVFD